MARAKRQTKQQKIDAERITDRNIKEKIEACLESSSKEAIEALYKKVRYRKKQKSLIRALKRKHYEYSFPAAKDGDLDRVNLREIWIVAYSKLDKPLSSRVKENLRNKGYLRSSLSHIQQSKIGTADFLEFKKNDMLHLTDEFIAFNFYADRLNQKQIDKIFDKIYNEKSDENKILSKFEIYKLYPPVLKK